MNIIINGKKQSGKTRVAEKLVSLLRQKGIAIGGVLNVGDKLLNVGTGTKTTFHYETEKPNTLKIGKYFIDTNVLAKAEELVKESVDDGEYTFIDECGKLELQQQNGFYKVIKYSLPKGKCIICIRDMNVNDFLNVFEQNKENTKIFTLTEENRDALPQTIYNYITETK